MNHLTLPKVSNQSTFANQTDLLKAVRMEWKQTTTAAGLGGGGWGWCGWWANIYTHIY